MDDCTVGPCAKNPFTLKTNKPLILNVNLLQCLRSRIQLFCLLLVLVFTQKPAGAQTLYDWLGGAPDGNFRQGASGARWNPGGLFDEPPSTSATRLRFNNNTFTTMTNNVSGTYTLGQVFFGLFATTGRTIGGNPVQFFEFGATWPRIENQSTTLHTINFPFSASTNNGFNMELVASAGPLVFGGTINNNGRTVQIYGNGTATDANNRYVRLGGIVSGSGVLNVSQFGAVRLNAAHTYTGQTQIDNGELWIESGGSIASGSGIFVGNGGQLGNVAKLWLSNASGGTTFSNSLTINDGNLTTREIGGLNTSGTHTFSGGITNNSTTGGLRLTALNAGGSVSFSGALGGAGSYIAPGAGTVTLSNTGNNYTGTTTVSGGNLRLGAANVIPNTSNIILAGGTFSTGATTGFADVMGTLQVTGNSTINFGTGFHNLEFANSSVVSWTPTANLIITGWVGPYDGVSGATAGGRFLVGFPNAGGLTSSQLARIYFFNGTNYYTATMRSNGEVIPNAEIAMFWGSTSPASWTTTSVTPRWDLNPTSTTFANNWATNRAAVFNVANSTITGASTNVASITANENVTTTASGTLNFGVGGGGIAPIFVASGKVLNLSTQTIATSVGYIKNGPGTLQLAGSAFTQGVTLNEGMIAVGGLNAMGNGAGNYLQINGGTIAGTASFNFTNTRFPGGIFVNGDFSLGSATPPALSTATLGFNNTVDLGSFSTRTITLGGTGIISLNRAISGTGTNLIIASSVASTLSLGAANTYTANTTINGGTLRCGIAGALPSSTNVTLANSTGVTLNLNNFSQTVASISGGGASGGNISIHTAAATAVLTVDQTTNTSYNGIISGSGGGFTKSGAGTLILGGANTYTGITSINGGTLQLGAAERIANTSNVVLSGGTLNTGGFSETLGTLTLNTSSVITLGAGAHNLNFANSFSATWASGSIATLIINGWTGTAGSSGTAGKIFFGNSQFNLSSTQLAQISFTGYSPGAILLNNGELVPAVPVTPGPPSVTSFNPSSGQIGTLVTITGINLGNPTAFSIGGIAAISVSNDGTTLVGMVMPGASTGAVSVTTAQGTSTSGSNFTVRPTPFPTTQQGTKLVGTGATGAARQGQSVALSANGNTAIVGGINDNGSVGAVWVYTRSGSTWSQQGTKLVGTGGIVASQGSAVALSADGNTAVVGGNLDNGNQGAIWVFVRSGSTWFQQGSKLVGTGATGTAFQGSAVAISADGNTILSGGYFDNTQVGAVWVFTRSSGFWSQQGSKLVGTGATGASYQGVSVALSADGNTAMVGGSQDNSGAGAAWVFTRSAGVWSQQGSKLLPTGATGNAERGRSVSLSADGNTALIGGPADNSSRGATWVFTRSGTTWSQQGTKLVGTGFTGSSNQGVSSALSADGNSAVIGGWFDNSQAGAIWVYTRSGTTWTQQGSKLVGTGATGTAQQGFSVGLSSDGFTAMVGGPNDNTSAGAAWIYVLAPPTITTTVAASSITNTTASSGGQTITGAALTAKGVVFSLGTVTTTPTLSNGVFTDPSLPVTASDFTGTLSGLAPQRQYYARAYASNAGGTGYATAVNFWTLSNPPSAQAGGLTATPTAAGQLTVNWTAATWPGFNANNAGYALIYSTATPTLSSTNGALPAAGVGAMVTVLSVLPTEPATSQIITGLTPGTTYNFLLVPYTWDGINTSTYHYLTASAPTTSATTIAAVPTAQPSGLVFSAVTASTITATWSPASGSPAGYLVLRSTGSSPNTDPVMGTSYNAGDVLGNATVVYAGSGVSTGEQSSLIIATNYFYEVFSYNGSGNTINYRTTLPLSGTQSTWLCLGSPALLTWYLDSDADGWYTNTQLACTSPGTGWTSTLPLGGSSDCDDNDPAKSQTFSFYADTDGDGFGAGSLISGICAENNTTPPAGYSTNNTDCAPTDPAINARFSFYADTDGDGFGAGGLIGGICAQNNSTPPAGYSVNNTDCAPTDNTKWQQATFFIDQDNDGYDSGTQLVCYGASAPSPYISTTLGSDCNDNNPLLTTSIPAPLTTDAGRCGPGSITISASTGSGETIDWYADASGGSPLLSNNASYNIPMISDTTIFYAEARNPVSGCVSFSRTALTVTVIPRPTATIVANDFVCEGQTAPIEIAFTGTTPWNLQYSINSVAQPVVNSVASSFSTSYPNATVAKEYIINSLFDGTGCSATEFDTLTIDVPIPCYITWNGSVSNDWNNANNWTPNNSAPSSRTSVVIPASANQPQISTASPAAVCANAVFGPGSNPQINTGFLLSIRGDLSGSGGNSFSGDGKLVLNGTGTQLISGTVRLGNVEFVNSNGGVSVPAGNRLEILPGATATFLPNSKLSNSGDFILGSNAAGTAKIGLIPTTASITGSVTIERWLPHGSGTGSWFLIGTPFSGQNFTGLSDDFRVCGPDTGMGVQGGDILPASQPERFTVFRYAENLNNTRLDTAQKDGWRSPANTTMNAGAGYRVYVNYYSNSLHKFDTKGTLNRNDFTFPLLTRTVNSSCLPLSYNCDLSLNGWNLLANPYPCPIDWNASAAWTKPANMNNAFYVWNSLAGGYRAYNGAAAVDLGVTINGEANPNVIPSSQAFFVKLLSGTSGSLIVKEAAKVTNTSGSFLRTASSEASVVKMRLKKENQQGYHFDAMVRFEEGSSDAFDAHRDMDILTGSSFEFGFPNSSSNLLLNSQEALAEETRIVPIKLDLKGQTGVFLFDILVQNVPPGSAAFIRDFYLGQITQLNEGSNFTFTVFDAFSGAGDRFELVISPNLVTGALPQGGKESFLLSPNPTNPERGAQVSINGFSGKEVQILVADVTGRKVISQKLSLHNGALVYPLNCSGIPAGMYSIQVTTADKKLIRKLVLR
jgi:autotransporter-associated beta strand protein